jgi:hypothetical protein
MFEVGSQRLARPRVPDAAALVVAGRGDARPVGAKHRGVNVRIVLGRRPEQPAGLHLANKKMPAFRIATEGNGGAQVGTDRNPGKVIVRPADRLPQRAIGGIPNPGHPVVAHGEQLASILMEKESTHATCVGERKVPDLIPVTPP